jgi:Fe-S cluster assembly scaffold protein SufB
MKTKLVKLKPSTKLNVTEDTQYVLDISSISIGSVNVILKKQGVSAEIIGMYVMGDGKDISLETISTHKAPNTSCMTNIKGVLLDNSKSNYIGKIIIEKSAQQTTSYLDDSVLVLGENTKNESQPILEIEADDVKASHGATTGRIDKEQIYYLTSRGLSQKEAENLIAGGFFESTLSKIYDEDVRNEIKKKLSDQWIQKS